MANIHSQIKRIQRSERERLENRKYTSRIKTYLRRLEDIRPEGLTETDEPATEQLFQEYVLARVPQGLVRTFGVTRSEKEGLGLQIHLARDPSPNEQHLLEQTIREALEQFRDRWK